MNQTPASARAPSGDGPQSCHERPCSPLPLSSNTLRSRLTNRANGSHLPEHRRCVVSAHCSLRVTSPALPARVPEPPTARWASAPPHPPSGSAPTLRSPHPGREDREPLLCPVPPLSSAPAATKSTGRVPVCTGVHACACARRCACGCTYVRACARMRTCARACACMRARTVCVRMHFVHLYVRARAHACACCACSAYPYVGACACVHVHMCLCACVCTWRGGGR